MMQDLYETKKEIPNFPDYVNSSNLIVFKYDNNWRNKEYIGFIIIR